MSDEEAGGRFVILMADDDHDDVFLAKRALAEARVESDFYSVSDGVVLLDFLRRTGGFDAETAPRPNLILLDLNMPRLDGHEILRRLKGDAALASIPVVVMTTSNSDEDVERAYANGAASYLRKPASFQDFVQAMATMGRYWLELVELPRGMLPSAKTSATRQE